MGDQNSINQDDWQVFNATGIGHLISIKYKIYLSFEG
jgi:competence protein ComEC